MMLILKLAFRNLLAHARSNIITFVSVGLVTCVLFLLLSFSDGQMRNLDKGVLALIDPTSDIVVYAPGYKTANDQDEDWERMSGLSIKNYDALLTQLRALPFVDAAGVPTTGLSMDIIAGGQRHEKFFTRGVDAPEDWLFKKNLRMKEGNFLGTKRPEVILHYKTAVSIKARPGDTVTLTGKDLFGQVFVENAVLSGYFKGEQEYPNLGEIAFVNRPAYELISGLAPGETMSLLLQLKEGESRKTALLKLKQWAESKKLVLEFWDAKDIPKSSTSGDDIVWIYGSFRLILKFIGALVSIIVAFGFMSIVSANLYDRKKEIGTYYCLGSEKGFLVGLYTLEILLINLTATIGGITTGLGVRQLINSLGITTEDSGMLLVFGGSRFSLGFSSNTVVYIFIAMAAVTVFTAITTLNSRLKVSPMAAIRDTD